MDGNRFFKFIWRLNAIAFAAILLFSLGLLSWEVFLRDIFRDRKVTEVVNIDPADTTIVETQKISVVERVTGHKLFRVSLISKQEYDSSSYSSKSTRNSTLNTGFYDSTTGVTKWLFPNQDQLITDVETLVSKSQPKDQLITSAETAVLEAASKDQVAKSAALGHLITYVDQDTSGDKRLSNSDKKKVLAVKPDGLDGEIILSGLKSDPVVWSLGSGSFVIFFTNDEGQHSAIYDAKALTIGPIQNISLP